MQEENQRTWRKPVEASMDCEQHVTVVKVFDSGVKGPWFNSR